MDNGDRIVISGAGLVTPVGHDSLAATAAIRAGVSRFGEIPYFTTPTGARCSGGSAYGLTDDRSGSDRLLSMGIPALQEALFAAEEFYGSLDLGKSRLLLCLAPTDRPRFEDFETEDLGTLLEMAEAQELGASTEICRGGHSAGIVALQKATLLLREGKVASCVVGGIDCLLDNPVLFFLDEAGRLKTEERSDGFIPGEAAAFLVLERESSARQRGVPILAELLAATVTQEEAHIGSGKPLFGHGLAQAIGQSSSLAGVPVHATLCDLNGEYYRTKEWALALPKLDDPSVIGPELLYPAENIGDVGAASAVVLVNIATVASARNYFSGKNVLIWTSSDDGARAAIVVRAIAAGGGALG